MKSSSLLNSLSITILFKNKSFSKSQNNNNNNNKNNNFKVMLKLFYSLLLDFLIFNLSINFIEHFIKCFQSLTFIFSTSSQLAIMPFIGKVFFVFFPTWMQFIVFYFTLGFLWRFFFSSSLMTYFLHPFLHYHM